MGIISTYEKIRKKIVVILNISGASDIFYYFVITKTLSLSDYKWILVYLGHYLTRKIIAGYM